MKKMFLALCAAAVLLMAFSGCKEESKPDYYVEVIDIPDYVVENRTGYFLAIFAETNDIAPNPRDTDNSSTTPLENSKGINSWLLKPHTSGSTLSVPFYGLGKIDSGDYVLVFGLSTLDDSNKDDPSNPGKLWATSGNAPDTLPVNMTGDAPAPLKLKKVRLEFDADVASVRFKENFAFIGSRENLTENKNSQ